VSSNGNNQSNAPVGSGFTPFAALLDGFVPDEPAGERDRNGTQPEPPAPPPINIKVKGNTAAERLAGAVQAAQARLAQGEALAGQRSELQAQVATLQAEIQELDEQARREVQPIQDTADQARLLGVDASLIQAALSEAQNIFEGLKAEADTRQEAIRAKQARIEKIEGNGAYQAFADRARQRVIHASRQAEAQMDHARRAMQAGRLDKARQLLVEVEDREDLPERTRTTVSELLVQVEDELAAKSLQETVTGASRLARAGDYAGALQTLDQPDSAAGQLAEARSRIEDQARRAWGRWMRQAEKTAVPGDALWTLKPWQAVVLRETRGGWDVVQAFGVDTKRYSTLPRRARRKPWRPGYPKGGPAATEPARGDQDSNTGLEATKAETPETAPNTVEPAPEQVAIEEPSLAPDQALIDYLAGLLADGYAADIDQTEAATVVVVETPEGRVVQAEARIRRRIDADRQRLRAEKLVRDLKQALAQ